MNGLYSSILCSSTLGGSSSVLCSSTAHSFLILTITLPPLPTLFPLQKSALNRGLSHPLAHPFLHSPIHSSPPFQCPKRGSLLAVRPGRSGLLSGDLCWDPSKFGGGPPSLVVPLPIPCSEHPSSGPVHRFIWPLGTKTVLSGLLTPQSGVSYLYVLFTIIFCSSRVLSSRSSASSAGRLSWIDGAIWLRR